MKIKKITFAILAIAFIAAFNSCKEEEEIQIDDEEDDWEYVVKQYDETTPHTPGTFVMFGANTYFKNGEEDTRTKYAEYPGEVISVNQKKYERIDWINGDMIQVFCEQSPTTPKHAVYDINALTIKPNENDKRQSVAAVTLHSGETGLRWGDESTTHIFQAIYPKPGSITYEGSNNWPRVYDPDDQYSLKFITAVPGQQDYEDNIEKMSLAGMVAKTTVSPGETGNVTLVFYPIVTTLQFDLVNTTNKKISIHRVYIDGVNGEPDISGTYDVAVPAAKQTISGSGPWTENPDIVFSGFSEGKGTVSVAIPYGKKDLAVNDQLRVVMYALPLPEGEFTNAKLAIEMDIYEDGEDADPIHITRRVALNKPKDTNANEKEYIVFKPTHKYNFEIKIPSLTVFKVTPPKKEFDVSGGECDITVKSYKTNALGSQEAVGWTATRYTFDKVINEDTDWIDFADVLTPDDCDILPTLLEGWGVFSTVDAPTSVTSFKAKVSENKPPYRKLKEATPAGNVDLSLVDVSGEPYEGNQLTTTEGKTFTSGSNINTANCYMVHASGTYRFPMVYGNAYKDGSINWVAFRPNIDRTQEEIKDSIKYAPYLKENTNPAIDDPYLNLPDERYYHFSDDDESRELFFGLGDTQERHEIFNVGWGKGWDLNNNPPKNHFLSPFIDHAGNGIHSPWILEQTNTATPTVDLLWQDAQGLITSVGIDSDDGNYITFTVTNVPDKLVEGNALIAVMEGSNVLWSWHIWVTEMTAEANIDAPETSSGGVYNGQTKASTIMGKELANNAIPTVTGAKIAGLIGLCDLSVGSREITIEFTQDGTGNKEYVTLTQKGKFDVNAPFYQYGRKDPLRFQKGMWGSDRWTYKTFYKFGTQTVTPSTFNASYGKETVYKGIAKPKDFCKNNGLDDKYYNLWAARLTRPGRYDAHRADRTKTIYDPCPAGYRVPALADVAGWAGNNSLNGIGPGLINGVNAHSAVGLPGRVLGNATYVILTLEPKGVYVPMLQGRVQQQGTLATRGWRLTETASWVSTPTFFSLVGSSDGAFTDAEAGISYLFYDTDKWRRSEDFYWYYQRLDKYNHYVLSRWEEAAQACHQIRFTTSIAWMNEWGGNRGNAVNLFMVKETENDTCTDNPPYYNEP